jgi:hypothetical protein
MIEPMQGRTADVIKAKAFGNNHKAEAFKE